MFLKVHGAVAGVGRYTFPLGGEGDAAIHVAVVVPRSLELTNLQSLKIQIHNGGASGGYLTVAGNLEDAGLRAREARGGGDLHAGTEGGRVRRRLGAVGEAHGHASVPTQRAGRASVPLLRGAARPAGDHGPGLPVGDRFRKQGTRGDVLGMQMHVGITHLPSSKGAMPLVGKAAAMSFLGTKETSYYTPYQLYECAYLASTKHDCVGNLRISYTQAYEPRFHLLRDVIRAPPLWVLALFRGRRVVGARRAVAQGGRETVGVRNQPRPPTESSHATGRVRGRFRQRNAA